MAWRIATWSAQHGIGTIMSPHLGPLAFGPAENRDGISDFVPGEAVLVELRDGAQGLEVVRLWLEKQRQPPGTEALVFELAQGHGDIQFREVEKGRIRIWCGDCCDFCSPRSVYVDFIEVLAVHGWSPEAEDENASNPLFRFASKEEIEEHGLAVPSDFSAFCIVTAHGNGDDGPRIFIVARDVTVSRV